MTESRPLIIRAEVTRTGLLKSRPVPGADMAMVFLDKRGRLYEATRALTAGEITWDTPKISYEVDISTHTVAFELLLPAEEKAFHFGATIVVHWRIGDPKEAVRRNLSDAEKVVRPGVEGHLRKISQRFTIESNVEAEDAIRRYFASGPVPLSDGIVVVACDVALKLDKSTQGHIASRTHAERKRERLKDDHETSKLETELTIQLDQAKQSLDQQRAEFAQLLEAQAEQHRLELERTRMEFYMQALSAGNLSVIGLRLASNRDDVNDVINLLMQQRQLDFDGARGMLNSLLENHLVNKRDVADIMARATTVVADHMTRRPFDVDWSDQQNPALNGAADPAAIAAAPVTAEVVREQDDDDNDFDDDDDERDH